MEAEFKKAKTVFEKAGSILLTMHEGMDGDDGGSVLAFQHFLESQGKRVASVIKHGVPEALSFLPGSEKNPGRCARRQI